MMFVIGFVAGVIFTFIVEMMLYLNEYDKSYKNFYKLNEGQEDTMPVREETLDASSVVSQ